MYKMNYETIKEFYNKNTQIVIIVGILLAIVIYHYYSANVESFTAGNVKYITEKLYILDGIKDKKTGKIIKVNDEVGLGIIPMKNKQLLVLQVSSNGIQKSILTPTKITKNSIDGSIEMLTRNIPKNNINIYLKGKNLYFNVYNTPTIAIFRLANNKEESRLKNMLKLSSIQDIQEENIKHQSIQQYMKQNMQQ